MKLSFAVNSLHVQAWASVHRIGEAMFFPVVFHKKESCLSRPNVSEKRRERLKENGYSIPSPWIYTLVEINSVLRQTNY